MKETTEVAELPLKLASLLDQLGSAEVKHAPDSPNKKGLPVIGVVNNMITRRLYSFSEELRLSAGVILGGPVEDIDQLLDAMPGPAKRSAQAKLAKLSGQLQPLTDLFWALVKEEIPCPTEDSSEIALYENWEVVLLPARKKSFFGDGFTVAIPSELLDAVRRAQAAAAKK